MVASENVQALLAAKATSKYSNPTHKADSRDIDIENLIVDTQWWDFRRGGWQELKVDVIFSLVAG